MPEVDRISPDQDESVSSEPLGIKEPLRSPTALGQSRFLMPLGLRSLSVLQSIAVHPQVDPQVDDFDFSSVQAAEPTPFQEPESPPNLQLFSFPEPRDEQRARFEIPARDRFERSETDHPLQINSLPQKPSTSPKPHPGTSLPQPVQGVVQFFKSVFGRKDSPVPEQTSTPEFLSVAASPQPLSAEPPLVQPQRDTTAPAEPPQATLSSELASPFFFDRSKAAPQNLPGSNLETLQQAKDLPEGAATYAVTQQVSGSSSEILQRAKDDEINVSKDASFPFASSQAPFQKNVDSLSVDSQALVSTNDLDAIALTRFNSENAPELEPQKIISEDTLIPALNTIQLQQKDKLNQELSPSFLQDKTLSENLIHLPETTIGETDLEKSLTTKEVSTSKNQPGESPQIQRKSVGQSTDSVQSISSVEI
ncbi:MAG: hypothetical protein LH679_00650, partial [Cyanobacteria bacterium CAN_BIN43]|nr:hypothetical protein [Cyanobacteria bacterium CAN_BIN43]